jgi:phosphonate transport system substrate-binding protein
MRTIKNIVVIALLGFTLMACTSTPQQEKPKKELKTYRIGYMICNSEKETLERFVPFTAFLSKKLGVNFEPVAIDTINFTQEMDNLDFTHTNSLLYIILNRFHGVDILAAEEKGSLGEKSQGIIIARKDSGLKNIEDLKGKTMIFGPTLGPTGFMSQIDLMQEAGVDPDNDLAFYTIPAGSFKHEKVAYGVLFERYDAGALPLDDIEIMTADGRLDPDDFTIIARAEPVPYCNFGVSQKVDDSFANKFKDVILGITENDTVEINGEVVKVLDRALVQGYVDITDAEFDSVREMAKRTNMPPYQKF